MLTKYEWEVIQQLLGRIGVGIERLAEAEEARNQLLQIDRHDRREMFLADQRGQQQRWAQLTAVAESETPFAPTDGG